MTGQRTNEKGGKANAETGPENVRYGGHGLYHPRAVQRHGLAGHDIFRRRRAGQRGAARGGAARDLQRGADARQARRGSAAIWLRSRRARPEAGRGGRAVEAERAGRLAGRDRHRQRRPGNDETHVPAVYRPRRRDTCRVSDFRPLSVDIRDVPGQMRGGAVRR